MMEPVGGGTLLAPATGSLWCPLGCWGSPGRAHGEPGPDSFS